MVTIEKRREGNRGNDEKDKEQRLLYFVDDFEYTRIALKRQ